MQTNRRGRNRRESHITCSVMLKRAVSILDLTQCWILCTLFFIRTVSPSPPRHLSHLLLLRLVLHELPVVEKSVWHVAAAMLEGFGVTHVMKSASSELAAFIGGVEGFFGPLVAQ